MYFVRIFKWLIIVKLCVPQNYTGSPGYADKFEG